MKGEGTIRSREFSHDAALAVREIVTRTLSDEEDIRAAYLFGSAAVGRLNPESDIDIGVWMNLPLRCADKVRLIEKLSSACLRPVDLLDLRQAGPVLLKEILQKGNPLIEPDADVLEQLYQNVVRNEADYLPLLRGARKERVEIFAHGR